MATNYYYIQGNNSKQYYVLKALTDLGGINSKNYACDDPLSLYYIDINDSNIYKTSINSELGQLLQISGDKVTTSVINLPNSWDDYVKKYDTTGNYFSTLFSAIPNTISNWITKYDTTARNLSSSYIAFIKLTYLRDVYRMGWLPDIGSPLSDMFYIRYFMNELDYQKSLQKSNLHFSFQDEEITKLFIKNFGSLLWEARYLMGYEDSNLTYSVTTKYNTSLKLYDSSNKPLTYITNSIPFYIMLDTYDSTKIKMPTYVLVDDTKYKLEKNSESKYVTELITLIEPRNTKIYLIPEEETL